MFFKVLLISLLGDGPSFRDFVIESGVVDPLLNLIKQNTPVGIFFRVLKN